MEAIKVGIREFRADIAEYLTSSQPVAITRHGQTVGYFIPTHRQIDDDVRTLQQAGAMLDRLLASKGITDEALVSDFKAARKAKVTSKSRGKS